jgi:hypothetical protein
MAIDYTTVFEKAISRSVRYWRRYRSGDGMENQKFILVDLMVDHPAYYLGNLIIAKYLELLRGYKPWALVSSTEDQKVILLAKSFGVERFTFVRDEVAKEALPEAGAILQQFEDLSGAELRRRVLALNVNGIQVGDLLYDTYVREMRKVTLLEVDDDLRAFTVLMLNYFALYDKIFRTNDIAATITGHLVYLRFGLLARLSAEHGADVYARSGGKGMRIQRRRDLAAVSDVITRVSADLVDRVLAGDGDEAVRNGRETLSRRMSGTNNEFKHLNEESYSPTRNLLNADELHQRLGLDPGRPKALLMLHAFPDATHAAPGLLFDDYYDWFRKTLDIARELPEIDWLIKMHPHQAYYAADPEPTETASRIANEVSQIHLLEDGMNSASLPEFVNFLITIDGSAGLEFGGCGVPIILGGRGFVAGLGFTEEPKNLDEYADTLARGPELILTAAQHQRALAANDLYYRRMVVNCRFMPDISYNSWTAFDEGAFWQSYLEAMENTIVENDEIFQALYQMLEMDAHTALRTEEI